MPRRKTTHQRAGSVENELLTRTRQQSAVAELGNLAVSGVEEDTLFEAAATGVAETLEVEASGILELLPGGDALLLRAGAGWRAGLAGRATLGSGLERVRARAQRAGDHRRLAGRETIQAPATPPRPRDGEWNQRAHSRRRCSGSVYWVPTRSRDATSLGTICSSMSVHCEREY
jgi:hypothetical protein